MTAENKVSLRQLRRMLFIEMFGAGALSVPALACYNGQSGGVAVLFYGIFLIIATVVFYILSEKIQEQFSENAKSYTEILPKSIQSIYKCGSPLLLFWGNDTDSIYAEKQFSFYTVSGGASSLVYAEYESAKKSPLFRTHISMDFCVVWYCSFLILCGH